MEELIPRDALYNWRKKSWDRFQEIGKPPSILSIAEALAEEREAKPISYLSECPHRLVFVDGFFSQTLSQLPEALICSPLDQAMRSYGVFLQNRIARTLKEETDPMAALNGAFQGKGILLYVPPRFHLESPLEIQHHFTTQQMVTPRIHLYLGRSSSLELIQTYSAIIDDLFCNALIDATCDEDSSLKFMDVQTWPGESRYFQAIRASLKKESRFSSLALMQGAKSARTSYKIQLAEENSEALVQGLARLNGERQNEIHALIEHIAPHTRSRQTFKAILEDRSRSSFEGKIYVRPTAQKTEAYQLNANLPLGPDVEIRSKPNLEIFADDVKASHGATIAEIQEEDLFYLRSRGLSQAQARLWLVRGFSRDLLDQVPFSCLKRGFEDSDA